MGDPEDCCGRRGTRQGGSVPAGPAKGLKPEGVFDLWLRRSLHQMFDSIKDEAIPPELLRLIEDDRTRRRGG